MKEKLKSKNRERGVGFQKSMHFPCLDDLYQWIKSHNTEPGSELSLEPVVVDWLGLVIRQIKEHIGGNTVEIQWRTSDTHNSPSSFETSRISRPDNQASIDAVNLLQPVCSYAEIKSGSRR